jgi:malate dehydrogenase (oxaloacetate-decarboxylating)
MQLDCTFRVQIPHRAGQLAKVTGAIGEGGGIIGELTTVSLGRETSVRDITVEVEDMTQAERIAGLVEAIVDVKLIWYRDRALLRHEGGKLFMDAVHPITTVQEMRDYYTPGVARVADAIAAQPSLASRYTMIGRSVAICTNGTRVLGLGDIGPVASMPVMEGKAVFYRQFAGISAIPILIDTKDPDTFVDTVIRIAPTFGGIHLEDIAAPTCFDIERRLIEAIPKPVMHDDVHGTAVVALAAVMTACRQVGINLERAAVGQIGLGAAGYGIAALMADAGVRRVLGADPSPDACRMASSRHRIEITDIDKMMLQADVVVATTGKPGLIKPSMVRRGQIILALSNPYPEIEPEEAMAAGAAFAADGRSVNNVLGYPGIFRGALLAGARRINLAMKLMAARALAAMTEPPELVPDPLDRSVHERVAQAVVEAAMGSGVANPQRAPTGL